MSVFRVFISVTLGNLEDIQDRGSSGTGSTGLAEPVDFGKGVLKPVNFSERSLLRGVTAMKSEDCTSWGKAAGFVK